MTEIVYRHYIKLGIFNEILSVDILEIGGEWVYNHDRITKVFKSETIKSLFGKEIDASYKQNQIFCIVFTTKEEAYANLYNIINSELDDTIVYKTKCYNFLKEVDSNFIGDNNDL